MHITRPGAFIALLMYTTILFGAGNSPSPAKPYLPDFTANYTLKKSGLAIASMRVMLVQQQGHYTYTSLSRTVGLVSLFRDDRIMEQSRGQLVDGYIQPHEYRYQRTGKKHKEIRIDFDWTQHQALHDENGNKTTIAIDTHAVDEFVNQLALMLDLQRQTGTPASGASFTYKVVDEGVQKDRSFATEGTEQVRTGAGEFNAIRIRRARTEGNRITWFWCAPALHYLPVKIEHVEGDGGKLILELEKVEGLGERMPADTGKRNP